MALHNLQHCIPYDGSYSWAIEETVAPTYLAKCWSYSDAFVSTDLPAHNISAFASTDSRAVGSA